MAMRSTQVDNSSSKGIRRTIWQRKKEREKKERTRDTDRVLSKSEAASPGAAGAAAGCSERERKVGNRGTKRVRTTEQTQKHATHNYKNFVEEDYYSHPSMAGLLRLHDRPQSPSWLASVVSDEVFFSFL